MAMAWTYSELLPDPDTERTFVRRIHASAAITLLLFLYSVCSFSQQLMWSDAARNDRALERVRAISQTDTIFHVIEERDDHVLRWLHIGMNSLKQVSSKQIDPISDNAILEHFFIRNDTLHTIHTRWNKDSDRTDVILMRYDFHGAAIGPEQILHHRDESSEPRRSGLQCLISPDSTRVLLFFDKENERRQGEGVHFKCFDRSWNLRWEKDLRLPPSTDILQVHHFLVDNYGGVYLMSGRKPVKTNSDWQRPQGGQYVVYYYHAERNKLKQYDISLKDKQVISVDFKLNEEQDVVIAGYYSDNFQNKAAGTLLFKIQARGESISLAGYTPFAKDFLKDIVGREKGTLDDFYLDYMHLTPEGSVILAGEQYYVSRSVSTDPATGRQLVEYRYNYDDILVCTMDSAARHTLNILVPKRQMTSSINDPNISYAFSADSTGIALTFNDDSSNNELASSKKRNETALWAGSKNSVTTRIHIDEGGTLTRRTLVDNNKERLLFNPIMTVSAPWARNLLGYDDKRTYKFCRIP
jgi:hypothetical protein